MTVKRYTPTQCCEHGGTYVTYSDYQKLVAENVALKKYAKIDDYDKCDNCGFESYVMPIETPATDAAVAEIKPANLMIWRKALWNMRPSSSLTSITYTKPSRRMSLTAPLICALGGRDD